MLLSEIIQQKIACEGPISFHDFMDMCLYYPNLGYYTSAGNKIGSRGDYYTSANISTITGVLIGKQIEEMWRLMGEQPFTIVEFGAGTGMLSHDILDYLQRNKQLNQTLRYCIIEKSPGMRDKERRHLPEKIKWYNSLSEIGHFNGCVFSNELLDNFPVHRVIMEDTLKEIYVGYEHGFTELALPATQECHDYLRALQVRLPEGFSTEVNLDALQWLKDVSDYLQKGFVITIDYGYLSPELYSDRRSNGTLVCYHQHTVNERLYQNIGSQDITAHVNFSALQHWGNQTGLNCCGLTSQAQFLLALGLSEQLNAMPVQGDPGIYLKRNAMVKHLLLFDMGKAFKVLVQCKGVPHQQLSCMALGHIN